MGKTKILYIEDDESERKRYSRLLRSKGFAVDSAPSGESGLKKFVENQAEVILCDLNMPGMNGLEVLTEAQRINPEIPFIITTAHGSIPLAVKAIKQGAYDFILKPLEIDEIVTTVQKAIEKTKLQKALRKSESSLQMLMENVPDIVYSLNPRGEFLSVSPAGEAILGYKPSDMVGTSVFDYIYSEDFERVKAGFEHAVKTGNTSVKTIEFRMVAKSGEVKDFEVNRRLIVEKGQVIRQDGIARDVSRRKQLEDELKKYSQGLEKLVQERTESLEYATRQLAALNAASNRFTLIHDEDELLDEVPELLTHSLDFDRAFLLLEKDGELALRSYCMEKDPPDLVESFLKRIRTHKFVMPPQLIESFEQNKTIFIPDLNADRRWPREPGQIVRTKAVVVCPIKVNKKPIGVILGNMQHHEREMDAQDVARFEMFANMVGLALDNIRSYQSLERKVIERTRSLRDANRELREKAKELEKTTYSLGNANVQLLSVQEQLQEKNAQMQKLLTEKKKVLAELEKANQHLKQTQAQLVQSEKMASLGMLVAGIAHEINTPIGAIHSMHDTLMRAMEKLKGTLATQFPDKYKDNRELNVSLETIEDANRVIESGCERVTDIVRRLRSFARLDEAELKKADIHEGLEDTLALIYHEIKHNITVTKNYGDIPPIACYPGRLNQVFLNILINAKQAIKGKGEVIITTFQKNDKVHVEIKDTGVGIAKEHLNNIFDPGFTTKGVGIGTGLGLSICYQIIQDHKGEIKVDSEVGKGSTFTVTLPMNLDKMLENN